MKGRRGIIVAGASLGWLSRQLGPPEPPPPCEPRKVKKPTDRAKTKAARKQRNGT